MLDVACRLSNGIELRLTIGGWALHIESTVEIGGITLAWNDNRMAVLSLRFGQGAAIPWKISRYQRTNQNCLFLGKLNADQNSLFLCPKAARLTAVLATVTDVSFRK